MAWPGLLLCALDGFQVRIPDTPPNRKYFGSSGTADNSFAISAGPGRHPDGRQDHGHPGHGVRPPPATGSRR